MLACVLLFGSVIESETWRRASDIRHSSQLRCFGFATRIASVEDMGRVDPQALGSRFKDIKNLLNLAINYNICRRFLLVITHSFTANLRIEDEQVVVRLVRKRPSGALR